jgi:hypothetical protein
MQPARSIQVCGRKYGFRFREGFTVCTDCEVFLKPESSTINPACLEYGANGVDREAPPR